MIKYTELPYIVLISLFIFAVTLEHYIKYGVPSAIITALILITALICIHTLMPKYMDWARRKDMERQKRKEAKPHD